MRKNLGRCRWPHYCYLFRHVLKNDLGSSYSSNHAYLSDPPLSRWHREGTNTCSRLLHSGGHDLCTRIVTCRIFKQLVKGGFNVECPKTSGRHQQEMREEDSTIITIFIIITLKHRHGGLWDNIGWKENATCWWPNYEIQVTLRV